MTTLVSITAAASLFLIVLAHILMYVDAGMSVHNPSSDIVLVLTIVCFAAGGAGCTVSLCYAILSRISC